MARIFVIFYMQFLWISSYSPSASNLSISITFSISGTNITLPPIYYYIASFKAFICHGISLILSLEIFLQNLRVFIAYFRIVHPLDSILHFVASCAYTKMIGLFG
jgi:hypothetical protein